MRLDFPQEEDAMPPPKIMLEADARSIALLVGELTECLESYKRDRMASRTFRIADLHLYSSEISRSISRTVRHHLKYSDHLRFSGTLRKQGAQELFESLLTEQNLEGHIIEEDASSVPASHLRNRLGCGGGADLVLYAHAAYPAFLPKHKLARMVDRLSDMVSPIGGIVTLHNHGQSDVELISDYVLGHGKRHVGHHCGTQQRLQEAFADSKLHSFAVTVANVVSLPANRIAIRKIIEGRELDCDDSRLIYSAFCKIAGGETQLKHHLDCLNEVKRRRAMEFFDKRILAAGGKEMPITVGGGQLLFAFRNFELAKLAFHLLNIVCREMHPPAIAIPLSRSLRAVWDEELETGIWNERLTAGGIITPPQTVLQSVAR